MSKNLVLLSMFAYGSYLLAAFATASWIIQERYFAEPAPRWKIAGHFILIFLFVPFVWAYLVDRYTLRVFTIDFWQEML
ncbi:hypothetical protein C5Y93_28150 [Blastopirellula marina]|uniref:Uncharacterized protein n=1 Tax=Blastopirellula marina TaxID=124 RepID=A0A2S8GDA2_9BACT|nr:hypothetical protein C5Y93_28150 [Blastopirellula marina]